MPYCKYCKIEIKEEDIVRIDNNQPICEKCAGIIDHKQFLKLFIK